jgi:hypothetical protein
MLLSRCAQGDWDGGMWGFFALIGATSARPRTRPMCPRAKVIKRADAVWIEPRYEAEVAEPLGMRLQILFGVVGMSMWLTP